MGKFLLPHMVSNILCQKLVIKTSSVEFMPFYLSLSTFLMSLSFSIYGVFKYDPFIYVSIILPAEPGIFFIFLILSLYMILSFIKYCSSCRTRNLFHFSDLVLVCLLNRGKTRKIRTLK